MYQLLRPLLFAFEPETAHSIAMKLLSFAPSFMFSSPQSLPIRTLNQTFKHPVGLAAGFDKNGLFLPVLEKLGFSFIEFGTVTPKAQPGNNKPRIFRIKEKESLINRMGFNNYGVDALVANIRRYGFKGAIGVNIGKNKDTSIDKAIDDYLYCLRQAYATSNYITLNISSPNTENLRNLQQSEYFDSLISTIREEQLLLADAHKKYVPILVKLSPDEDDDSLKRMAESTLNQGIDGLILTNTTLSKNKIKGLKHADELGGVSGNVLYQKSTHCLRVVKEIVGDELTLISVGGIDSSIRAKERILAGATLLQCYTGLIYKGPQLINALIQGCADALENED